MPNNKISDYQIFTHTIKLKMSANGQITVVCGHPEMATKKSIHFRSKWPQNYHVVPGSVPRSLHSLQLHDLPAFVINDQLVSGTANTHKLKFQAEIA